MLFGNGKTLFNAGFITGGGIGFSRNKYNKKKKMWKDFYSAIYYRYSAGVNYGVHMFGSRAFF